MSLPTLLFIDVTTPRPYDPSCTEGKGIGGTEQTMVTLAEGLAGTGLFNVVVEQHNKFAGEDYQGKALYTYLGATQNAKWVVVLRDPRPINLVRERFRDAKIYLFSHDLADRNLGICYQQGFFNQCLANICVSEWHKGQTAEVLKAFGFKGEFKLRFIYNTLSDDVVKTNEPYDKYKLVWLASPHKGINKAYEIFKQLIKIDDKFRLYVTNPGYFEDQYSEDKEVKDRTIVLGTIPHKEAIKHLRDSLCLFYPNNVFPETFGKVLAEANEVGTPVITSPIGASREILDTHPEQIVDCRNNEEVIKRIIKWHSGQRPIVRGNPKFKLHHVLKEWIRLLNNVR